MKNSTARFRIARCSTPISSRCRGFRRRRNLPSHEAAMSDVPFVEVEQLRDMLQSPAPPLIIDVREKWENDLCSLPGSRLIPLGDLPKRAAELPKDQTV